MTPFSVKPGGRALVMMTTAFVAIGGFSGSLLAATAANTIIQNQAVATYKDAGGNTYTAQSNLAEITVRQVYAAEIAVDREKEGAAGQTVYSTHTLTNLGNGEDTYTIDVAQYTGGLDTTDFTMIEVFVDSNSNGIADPGETVVASTNADGSVTTSGTVTLLPDEAANLLVAAQLPGVAPAGETAGAILTATPTSGDVVDTTTTTISISDTDPAAAGTNHLLATVTDDAVLNVFKSASHDETTNAITYTVTVTNTGNKVAEDVVIFDAIPANTVFDATFTPVAAGFGSNPGDVAPVSGTFDETVYGADVDGDGVKGVTASGVYGTDAAIAPGTTVTMTFRVTYDPTLEAGTDIVNVAHANGDLDGDGNPEETPSETAEPSNPVGLNVPETFGVTLVDTGVDDGAGVNDGGDDDGAGNGVQVVDTAPAGETVIFDNIVTNTGNSTEPFQLDWDEVASTFPAGTIFSVWTGNGTVQLLDTDGDGLPNTPPLSPGETYDYQFRAILPADTPATAVPMTIPVTAISTGDPTSTATVTNQLNEITAATVDLSNGAQDDDAAVNQHEYTAGSTTPITTMTGNPGETVDFTIVVENDGGTSDAFQLYAGGGWFDGAATPETKLQPLAPGWSVQFIDAAGNSITTTQALTSGNQAVITARVSIPAEAYKALADYSEDTVSTTAIADGVLDVIDTPVDGDGDYPIFFVAKSISSGAYDVKLDAVDVNPVDEFTVLADQSNQISPGGSSTTEHTVTNTGNTDKTVELTSTNTLEDESWGQSVMVDTNGDGIPDTPIEAVNDGDTVYIEDVDGSLIPVVVADDDTDGNVEIPLAPGQTVPVEVTVYAPTSAPNGQVDLVNLVVTDEDGVVQDNDIVNTVVVGKLRLFKTASVDATCTDAATADLGPDDTFLETGRLAAPGDCVVWQVVAVNTGADLVTDVVIEDAVPGYTVYQPGTLRACAGDAGTGAVAACTFSSLTDIAGDDEGVVVGDDVTYTFDGSTGLPTTIGAGESITVRFAVQVE